MNINNEPFGSQKSHFTGKPDIVPGGFSFDLVNQKLDIGDIVSAGTLAISNDIKRTIQIIKTAKVFDISDDGKIIQLYNHPYNDPCFKVGEYIYKANCQNIEFSKVPQITKIKRGGSYVIYLSIPISGLQEEDILQEMINDNGIATGIGKANCITIRDVKITELDTGVDISKSTGVYHVKEKLVPPIPDNQKDHTGCCLEFNPHIKFVQIL